MIPIKPQKSYDSQSSYANDRETRCHLRQEYVNSSRKHDMRPEYVNLSGIHDISSRGSYELIYVHVNMPRFKVAYIFY